MLTVAREFKNSKQKDNISLQKIKKHQSLTALSRFFEIGVFYLCKISKQDARDDKQKYERVK